MIPFLKQTALHYAGGPDAADKVFVLPNRRSQKFFEMYWRQAKSAGDVPYLLPRCCSINEFFEKASGIAASDKVSLLVELYSCYKVLDRTGESLDDFIYWGDIILSDFDDVDKYLVNAEGLYSNISDLKDMEDDFTYMTERQKEAVRLLAKHFSAGEWNRKPGVKQNFLTVWQILLPLYRNFRKHLSDKGMAYEGMVYRSISDRLSSEPVVDMMSAAFPGNSGFVFIGLNALNECEKAVLSKMRDARIAEFCWDFPGEIVCDRHNAASHFLKSNLESFPPAFIPDQEGLAKPAVHVIGVPSATGQSKLLPDIIRGVPAGERALDFALVLPDETMLSSVLGSIPPEIPDINVTMGYPLASSEFYVFMNDALAMQMHLRLKGGEWYFHHRQVSSLFANGTLRTVLTEEENEVVAKIRKDAKYYIPRGDFGESPLMRLLFSPVVQDLSSADPDCIEALASWQLDLVRELVARMDPEGDTIMTECAYRYYRAVSVLKEKRLPILPQTWAHLVAQTANALSVPFEGEPLGGMQVMGPLETRALDFKNIVILSASEGVFPRRSVSSSFIPPELRRAFGLPTYEYQDAVWAYYFYRMIARADNVWLIYDSRPDAGGGGEESRYIKQLRYLYPEKCVFDEAVASSEVCGNFDEPFITKTPEDMEKIRSTMFSASSIQNYISCPAAFYYLTVKGLKPESEVVQNLDPGLLGTVCHDTLWALYCGEGQMRADNSFDKRDKTLKWENVPHLDVVTADYLEGWMSRKGEIRNKILSLARRQLQTIEVAGRDLVAVDIALHFVLKVISRDLEQIRAHGPLRILGLEKKYEGVEICGHPFVGFIDRLDSFSDGSVRVVDYKTGSDRQAVLDPGKDVAKSVRAIFNEKTAHANKAALQFFVYDSFIDSDPAFKGREVYNSMYAMSDIFSSEISVEPASEEFKAAVSEELSFCFGQMEDPDVPFKRSQDVEHTCRYCDFKMLCGRVPKD